MPRFMAIDWSGREVRFAIASGNGSSLKLEAAIAVPLNPSSDSTLDGSQAVGVALQQAMAIHRAGRAVVLVSVDRSRVELLEMTLPPAEDCELPEMVLNQAMRESSAITEDSALDFVSTGGSTGEPRRVRAVAMSVDQLSAVCSICESAGIVPERIIFRPFAATSLFLRYAEAPDKSWLLVNVVNDAADLTLVSGGRVVLTRTLRLAAGDAVSAAQKLSTEIRRTVVLAPADASSGEGVAGIILFGRDDDHKELAERIESETSLEVRRFDPFDAVGAAAADVPADSGRFAALLGMLADEAAETSHAVDLLHPRRSPRAPSRRRPMVLIAGAAALAVCIAGGIAWSDLSQVEATNTNLNKELKELDTEIKKLDKSQQLASAIEDWERGGINWLDELKELSIRFPSSRDAVVLRMSMSPSRGGGGVITLQGQAREPAVVEKIGTNIRDPNHEIQTPRVQERLQEKSYTWHFETSIYVTGDSSASPKKESDRVAGSPAEPSVSSDASETTTGTSRSAKAAVRP